MEAAISSKMPVIIYESKWQHAPYILNLQVLCQYIAQNVCNSLLKCLQQHCFQYCCCCWCCCCCCCSSSCSSCYYYYYYRQQCRHHHHHQIIIFSTLNLRLLQDNKHAVTQFISTGRECSYLLTPQGRLCFLYIDTPYFKGGPGQLSRCDSLRAGRSGDRNPVRARFSTPFQTGPGAHPASRTMGTGSLPRG